MQQFPFLFSANPAVKQQIRTSHPARVISASFALVILVGSLLLCLPVSSRSGQFTDWVRCLFTATSATCVTGLVVFDTYSHWSVFGQVVILSMIQIGGLGLVTLTTFFNLMAGRKLGIRNRQLASQSVSALNFGETPHLIRMVIAFSLAIEAAGAVLLGLHFVPQFGGWGAYIAVFLSISAFCNAGFDPLGFLGEYVSVTGYNDSYLVLFTLMGLILIGGLGFLAWNDLLHWRKGRKLLLHTKVVVLCTLGLFVLGAVLIGLFEWDNPATLGALSLKEKIGAALFQSATLRTAGFNSVDIFSLRDTTKALSLGWMFIGAAPGSTGGGIKTTTLAVIVATALSVVRGREDPVLLRRRISAKTVYLSLTIAFFGLAVCCATATVLWLNCPLEQISASSVDVMVEAVSAFATVGISTGVTGIAPLPSLLMLILTMFIGRVGPVSFGMTLAAGQSDSHQEVLPEGKIIVG